MRYYEYTWFDTCDIQTQWHARSTECVALGVSMILCSTTDLVPTSVCMPLCLLFCLLLLLPAAAAWLGFLFCSTAEGSWVLLFWKECESVWLPKSMSGDLGGQSPKIWFRTSFGPRLHLVRTSFKLQPVKTQPREVLERLCNDLLLSLLLLLLLLLVLLLLGKARFFGRRTKRLFVKGLEAVPKKPKA